MTNYEYFITRSDECCRKAIEFLKKGDISIATFFKNASEGFKIKALKLTIDESEDWEAIADGYRGLPV